jgi:hypothetical protein
VASVVDIRCELITSSGVIQANKTVLAAAMNLAMVLADWTGGTSQHAKFQFTAADMTFALGRRPMDTMVLKVWYTTAAGSVLVYYGPIFVYDISAGDPPWPALPTVAGGTSTNPLTEVWLIDQVTGAVVKFVSVDGAPTIIV